MLLPVQNGFRIRFVRSVTRVTRVRPLDDVASSMSLQAVRVGEVAVAKLAVIELRYRQFLDQRDLVLVHLAMHVGVVARVERLAALYALPDRLSVLDDHAVTDDVFIQS